MAMEPEKERHPPAVPTQLNFPAYDFSASNGNGSEAALNGLYSVLSSIKRPQDISPARFQALNLSVESGISASCIVDEDRMNRLPPLPWNLPVDQTADSPSGDSPRPLMSNDSPYPARDRFDIIRDELLVDKDDAFREVARLPPREGRQRARITQTRKFWAGLERMSQYWDASLDNYYDRPATPKKEPDDAADKMQSDDSPQPAPKENNQPDPMDIDSQPTAQDTNANNSGQNGQTPIVTMYTGRRIGTGSEMPEDVREEAIRAFTEMAAWPFGCQAPTPNLPPRLSVKSLLFPVRQSFVAARSPRDRQLARKGVMEGPLLVGQCRPETTFCNNEEKPGFGAGEVTDLYREVGAMLLTAQERMRQGATEVKPGEGKWWATKPRWGGAPNDGIEEDVNNSDEQPSPENGSSRKRSRRVHPLMASRRPSNGRKLSNSERWKMVQPGPSLWDKRMTYMQLGKNKESPFDDVWSPYILSWRLADMHSDLPNFVD